MKDETSRSATLDELVARTAGPQPWRKVFHAFNASAMAIALAVLEPSRAVATLALLALTVALLLVDLARRVSAPANEMFFRAFGLLASPREARGIASSTWYAMGILLAVVLFPRAAAISGILVMGLSDPAAALVGRYFGKRPFLGGTLEGSAAFFAVSAVTLGLRHGWPAALVASVVLTALERRSWPLDDNLTVPVACAAMVAVFS